MKKFDEKEEFEGLPLRLVWVYLTEKGLGNEASSIRQSKDAYKSYTSTLRRGKVVKLLKENNALEEFVDKYWPYGKTQQGQNKIKRYERIYEAFLSSRGTTIETEEQEEEEGSETEKFALEEHLQEYLYSNLMALEPGLKLWKDDRGIEGVEYNIDEDGRRVDILAIDKMNVPVVIELKVSRGYQKVIGQCLYYKNRLKTLLNIPKVRIIIIAHEITPELKTAALDLPDIDLFEYKINFKVEKVK